MSTVLPHRRPGSPFALIAVLRHLFARGPCCTDRRCFQRDVHGQADVWQAASDGLQPGVSTALVLEGSGYRRKRALVRVRRRLHRGARRPPRDGARDIRVSRLIGCICASRATFAFVHCVRACVRVRVCARPRVCDVRTSACFTEPSLLVAWHRYEASAECSNRGSCDRKTGLCQCFDGFYSEACSLVSKTM